MLFFLYGEDSFRSKEKLDGLKKLFLKNNPPSGLFVFDFSEKEVSANSFLESIGSGGLFSEKKLIIASDFLKNSPIDNQKKMLEKLKEKTDLPKDTEATVIFCESGQPKKNSSFYKYLLDNSKKQEFNTLKPYEIKKWATGYTFEISPSTSFSPNALSLLISFVGNDLFLLKNELDKLTSFKPNEEIVEQDIELLVKAHTDSTVFQTIEALLDQNKKNALRLFHSQLQKGEDPFYLLSMYAYQIRTLLKISSAFESGNTNPQFIAKEAGVHPFVVQKSLPQIRKRSLEDLKRIYKKLEEIDIASKTGKTDLVLALDTFIVSI